MLVTLKTVSVKLCIVAMLVCSLMRVYELTVVSMDKVLCFINTLIIKTENILK